MTFFKALATAALILPVILLGTVAVHASTGLPNQLVKKRVSDPPQVRTPSPGSESDSPQDSDTVPGPLGADSGSDSPQESGTAPSPLNADSGPEPDSGSEPDPGAGPASDPDSDPHPDRDGNNSAK